MHRSFTREKKKHIGATEFEPHDFHSSVSILGPKPVVFLTHEVFDRMFHYVDIADDEIAWLGTAQKDGNNYLISRVFLLKQETNVSTAEITNDGLASFYSEIPQKYTGEETNEILNHLQFWGHLHPNTNQSTRPSEQDEKQMAKFSKHHPWFIRAILNKYGRMEFTIFVYAEGFTFRFEDVPWAIFEPVDYSIREQIEAEIQEKVTKKHYKDSSVNPTILKKWGMATCEETVQMYPEDVLALMAEAGYEVKEEELPEE